jgi:hypothetical protein
MQLRWTFMALIQLILLILKYMFVKYIDMWIVFTPLIITNVIITYEKIFRCFCAEYISNDSFSTNQEAVFV